MILTFTGTRRGMTRFQQLAVTELLKALVLDDLTEAQHGACMGADHQFHSKIIVDHPGVKLRIWPSNISETSVIKQLISNQLIRPGDVVEAEMPPLIRNQGMVNRCDFVLATPYQAYDVLRSGTWSTLRAAKRLRRNMAIVTPGGRILTEIPER